MRSNKFMNFFQAGQDASQSRLLGKAPESKADGENLTNTGFMAQIRNADDRVEIVMHDGIGDSWSGLDSGTVVKEIKAARGKPIDLDINSFGGLAFDGISIYNALAMHDAPVTANITGMAYSAASIIPLAADTINIAENGEFGIHPAWLFTMGNRFAFAEIVEWLNVLDSQLVATYAARTGQTPEKITEWFVGKNHDGTIFSGPDAVKYGFADGLIALKQKPKKAETAEDSKTGSSPQSSQSRLDDLIRRNAAAIRKERIAQLREAISSR